jgi:hypothetical protein
MEYRCSPLFQRKAIARANDFWNRSAEPFDVYHLGIWTEDYMLGVLKHRLRRRGKPIPADLQSKKYDHD